MPNSVGRRKNKKVEPAPSVNQAAEEQASSTSEPKKLGRRVMYDVSPEKFIETWQTSESADEVAQKLKMPKPIVHARVSNYRAAGVKMKKMKRHYTQPLDVAKLNGIIDRINKEQGNPDVKDGKKPEDSPTGNISEIVRQVMSAMGKKS